MIIIPEIETVAILIPRTASGSLRRAIATRYPQSMLLYRHMEADGVPQGYDRWRKVAVVRHPLDRMWSLYKFLRAFDRTTGHDAAYVEKMCRQVDRPFADWLVNNDTVFTSPYDSAGLGRFWPQYTCLHPLPENRKSQLLYVRPDLGTEILHFDDFASIERRFDVRLGHYNATPLDLPISEITRAVSDYVKLWFSWDLDVCERRCAA